MNRGDTFERIVELLNEAMLDDARWPQTSALIDEAFGAKGSVLGFGDEPTKGDYQIFFTKCYFRGINHRMPSGRVMRSSGTLAIDASI